MKLINLNYIAKQFSNSSNHSIKKIISNAKKSAVMCLFLENENKVYILLTKRSNNLSKHAGEICFPGGGSEKSDENLLDTAIRETYEEIGVPKDEIKVIGQLDDYITGTGFHISPFVGVLKSKLNFSINKNEVSELIYLPIEMLKDNNNHIWTEKKFGNKMYKFWKINYLNYNIWGATASILIGLASRL